MKLTALGSLIALLAAPPVWAHQPDPQQPQQDQQQQRQNPPTLGKQPEEQKKPTLGEAPPPLNGPRASTTTDVHRLVHVRKVFIEEMDNALDQKLAGDIATKGLFQIVTDRKQADAVLRGTCFDSARLKRVHSEVFLTGRSGESIWQDVVRQQYNPPPLARAVDQTAQAIVDDLSASIRDAQR